MGSYEKISEARDQLNLEGVTKRGKNINITFSV